MPAGRLLRPGAGGAYFVPRGGGTQSGLAVQGAQGAAVLPTRSWRKPGAMCVHPWNKRGVQKGGPGGEDVLRDLPDGFKEETSVHSFIQGFLRMFLDSSTSVLVEGFGMEWPAEVGRNSVLRGGRGEPAWRCSDPGTANPHPEETDQAATRSPRGGPGLQLSLPVGTEPF